eukprot:jgi/Ulvmu1/3916/UM018_0139.1
MVSCFSCLSMDNINASDELDPALVRQLYKQSLKANDGRLIVHGLFARANSVNNNMRLYPKKVLVREVRKYVRDQISSKCALGELDHPSYCAPTFKHLNLVNLSHQVLSVRWKGNSLWGFIEVLDTPSGRLVRHLYERGCKLGVSSRGWASLREIPGKPYKCIMDNFELITFDFVTEPSTRGAWLLPYAGRFSAAVPEQRYAEAISRLGVGAVLPEQFPSLPHLRDVHAFLQNYLAHIKRGQKCFPVRRMQGPKQWVMQERRRGDTVSGRGGSQGNGESRRRSEPAATDTTLPGIADAVCAGMADGIPMGTSAAVPAPSAELPPTMNVPVASNVVMVYPYGFQSEARVLYGAYVSLAHMFGVPSQRGLRDYWRHVYLFRERALAAAQVIEGGPQRSLHASTAPGGLDSQGTLMSLTSHQSFTVCGSTVTAAGSTRRCGGGSGVFAKAHGPPTASAAARASDTVIGPVAVAAGKAFRGSPDSHNSEGGDTQDDCSRGDGGDGSDMLMDAAEAVAHMHAGGDRRGLVQPSREMQRLQQRRESGGMRAHEPGMRGSAMAARSMRVGGAEAERGAGRAVAAMAPLGFHTVSDAPQWRSEGPRDIGGGGAAGRGFAQASPAAVLQFEQPRMHVTNKGGVSAVSHTRDRDSGVLRRGTAGVMREDRVGASAAQHGARLAAHAAGGPAAGTAPVVAWLQDHAAPRAAGVMAECTAQPSAMRAWATGHSHDGAEWVTEDSATALAPGDAGATGAGKGRVGADEIEQAAAQYSLDLEQAQGCWSSPCVRRGVASEVDAAARSVAQHAAERHDPCRQTGERDTPPPQHGPSGHSAGRVRSRSRSRTHPDDALAEPAASSSCNSGMHVVVARGLGIGRKRLISGAEAAQLQSSQDGDLLVYSSITSSQSPSRVVA